MNPKHHKTKILVVDDDHIMCELLKSILRREDYDVVGTAHNGEDALEKCSKLDPHVVCLDINMPKVGGLETLHALKVEHPEIIVIMVSAEATLDVVREAMEKGACGFIVKPYNAAKILGTIESCAYKARLS